ncbi:MAG: hypothetical protein L0271_16440, partial [Gemmatimonadetes bacterium]|nr:hypothetical protein [Gemmatimonadota bacterium]
ETLRQALALGDEERWGEMAELLAVALREEPEDAYLLCWAGVAERELGNDGAAYELFKRCVATQPLDAHLLALAGSGLAVFDDPEAEPTLRAAALADPELPIARVQYGAYLAREGMFEEAFEHLHAGVALAADDPVAHGELAAAFALKGDMSSAAEAFETAIELAPSDSWTRVLLGLVYAESDRLEEAAEVLVQAAVERTDDAEAQVLAALAAAAMGWDDAAENAVARAEYAAVNADIDLVDEAFERVHAGPDAARNMLLDTVVPLALHDRLTQPL